MKMFQEHLGVLAAMCAMKNKIVEIMGRPVPGKPQRALKG